MIHTEDKPPLTRRWTQSTPRHFRGNPQTSAHAEMDPHTTWAIRLPTTNLRSRGDGPAFPDWRRRQPRKPPLTRRWTHEGRNAQDQCPQTSAHAEMDPVHYLRAEAVRPNLRSRGDGPTQGRYSIIEGDKPPLTRRWTYTSSRPKSSSYQTSAHAEMDLMKGWSGWRYIANLRSRGDGPLPVTQDEIAASKPPLTRRWTSAYATYDHDNIQTSAHAEMDLWALYPRHEGKTNLRSRGDGPGTVTHLKNGATKPPLTRRWTYPPLFPIHTPAQTSAHAEMDRVCPPSYELFLPNLRSRGDGPKRRRFQSVWRIKPPLTRRWTRYR